MHRLWSQFKDNATAIGVFCVVLGLLGGLAKFALVDPMHQRFDAINQRFDAMGQRFDDINQRFGDINQRFGDLRAEMTGRFDAQDKYINERFNGIDERLDAVDQRFDAQDKRIDDLKTDVTLGFEQLTNEISEFRKLGERVTRNEVNIDTILRQLQIADQPGP